jgi:hypothetical protein
VNFEVKKIDVRGFNVLYSALDAGQREGLIAWGEGGQLQAEARVVTVPVRDAVCFVHWPPSDNIVGVTVQCPERLRDSNADKFYCIFQI